MFFIENLGTQAIGFHFSFGRCIKLPEALNNPKFIAPHPH